MIEQMFKSQQWMTQNIIVMHFLDALLEFISLQFPSACKADTIHHLLTDFAKGVALPGIRVNCEAEHQK